MNNNDLIKLTEIKQYFLDPPVTFKLPRYASEKLDESLLILEKYRLQNDDLVDYLAGLKLRIASQEPTNNELKTALIKAGRMIGDLNNR